MATPAEIESLKKNWDKNPYWPLEDTDGFEAHYAELKAYRLEKEAGTKFNPEDAHLKIVQMVPKDNRMYCIFDNGAVGLMPLFGWMQGKISIEQILIVYQPQEATS